MFLDESIITVRSGCGGRGCLSFRREKYIPRGGPDGGDGGRGGSVFLEADRVLTTLSDLSRQNHYRAGDGKAGGPNNCSGRSAEDLVVAVPVGTVVRRVVPDCEAKAGPLLGELLSHGERLLVARGGRGGRGNKSFATSTRQVPRESEDGQPGEESRIYLELKLLADVGLVGLPNAGKSTLLSRISAATPKIADYPFTTLQPNLGITQVGDWDRIIVADIPGLIEGAHRGAGLGTEFLRHIERTRILIHLVSVEAGTAEKMLEDYRTVELELERYSRDLASKPRIVAASKIDTVPPEAAEALLEALAAAFPAKVHGISAVSGAGVRDLLNLAVRTLRALPESP